MRNAISLTSVVYDVTNSWITHIKCVIVARCYSAPPPFRQSHVDDEENALVVLKMWIEGSVQDHHVVEGFRLVDHVGVTNVVIPYLCLNTATNKLDSNEQLLFLSLQNQKGCNMHNAISLTSVVYDVTNSWITHIKCVIVARCYTTTENF